MSAQGRDGRPGTLQPVQYNGHRLRGSVTTRSRTTMVQFARSPRLTRLAGGPGSVFHKVFHSFCEDLGFGRGDVP